MLLPAPRPTGKLDDDDAVVRKFTTERARKDLPLPASPSITSSCGVPGKRDAACEQQRSTALRASQNGCGGRRGKKSGGPEGGPEGGPTSAGQSARAMRRRRSASKSGNQRPECTASSVLGPPAVKGFPHRCRAITCASPAYSAAGLSAGRAARRATPSSLVVHTGVAGSQFDGRNLQAYKQRRGGVFGMDS